MKAPHQPDTLSPSAPGALLSGQDSFAALLERHRRRLALSQGVLASSAGCSRQYVAQLEAGRRQRPSRALVRRLADALMLRGADRERFFQAAGHAPETDATPAEWHDSLSPATEFVQIIRYPAYVHDRLWRLYGWNRAAELLFEVDPASVVQGATSLLEFVFDPVYRRRFAGWEPWARSVLAQFKHDSLASLRRPTSHGLVRRLRNLPDFTRLWRAVDPASNDASVITMQFRHSRFGLLSLRALRLLCPGPPALWVNIFLPETPTTRAALEAILAQTGNQLRGTAPRAEI